MIDLQTEKVLTAHGCLHARSKIHARQSGAHLGPMLDSIFNVLFLPHALTYRACTLTPTPRRPCNPWAFTCLHALPVDLLTPYHQFINNHLTSLPLQYTAPSSAC
jgi:hypothetical protein